MTADIRSLNSKKSSLGGAGSGHRRGGEFRDSQSMELPLDAIQPQETTAERRVRLREVAVRGSPMERVSYLLNEVFIPTPDFEYATQTINRLLAHARLYDNPGGMRIMGGGGTGKDTLIRYIKMQHPPRQVGRTRVCPIIALTFEATLAPTQILLQMHSQLNSAAKKYQTVKDLKDFLIDAMIECGTVGIFFNEAHHMLNTAKSGNKTELRLNGIVGDWLKRFIDDCKLPMFFMSIPGWDELFEKDNQLRTRISNRFEFSKIDDKTFVGILAAMDDAIPMPEPAGLAARNIAEQLFQITEANWRSLIFLLRDALLVASEARSSRIELCDLSYAYSLQFGKDGNPFGAPREI